MSRATILRLLVASISGLTLACANATHAGHAPAPLGAAAPAASASKPTSPADSADSTSKRKSLAATIAASTKLPGLFTLYRDTTTGALMMQVAKTQVGGEFIYFTHIVDAPLSAGYFRGAFGDNNIFTIRRTYNRLEFITENGGYWFDPQSPLSRSAGANVTPAVVAVQEIIAEDSASYLIKADDIFLTEAFTQIKPSPDPKEKPGENFALGTLSRTKSRIARVRNYPLNTDVVVDYVYENPAPVNRGSQDVTDPRNVSIVVQHSLIEMPKNDYTPRLDDPRVGYFTERVTDMVSASSTPYRDLIHRWNLVKKDPAAAISEPVEPITFWVENTTPLELRPAIIRGVLKWNEAFDAAGFRNAVVVKVQPDDADWDAGDLRYNVLRWTSSPNPAFGGYGPSFVNPRTGQILGADIMLEYIFITNRLRQEKAFATVGMELQPADGADPAKRCSYAEQLQLNVMVGEQALHARGASAAELHDYLEQAVESLVLHEVGHTLGLNHNMKASQMLSPKEMNDRTLTGRVGGMGSVMDYDIVNLARKGEPQGDYFDHKPGPYDVWAIQVGYTPSLADAGAERARAAALLSRSTEPALAFGNDADDMRAPGGGIDPRVNVSDMTNDAIGYAVDRFAIIDDLMRALRSRYATSGSSYHELRNAYLVLSAQENASAAVISRYVGGVYVDRAFIGQPGAGKPLTPVSRADQKRAMDALRRLVFAPDAFAAPADLYQYLQMQRRSFDFFGTTEDPKVHARVLTVQKNVLDALLHPSVLARITDSRLYGNAYPVDEMMADLTAAVFAADARSNVNTFRQNLQLEYVHRLAAMVTAPTAATFDYPAQSAALANLRSIQRLLEGRSGMNTETSAHTRHIQFVIARALKTT